MLRLPFADKPNIHTLNLVKPVLNKRNVGIRHVKLPLQFGKISSRVSRLTISRLHIKAARSLLGIMILGLPPLDGNQSLR